MSGRLPPEVERAFCAELARILERRHPELHFHVGPPEQAPDAEEAPEPPDLLEALARLERGE